MFSPDSDELLFTSPAGVDQTEVTDTFCLQVTSLLQYDIQMFSDNVNPLRRWSYDSWLSINGLYGHIIFKSDWRAGRIRISFYTPIDHEMSWFWTTNYSSDWKTCSTDSWSLTSGGSFPSSDAVHYLRKSFTGLLNMAAYETQFFYRFGIVAYMNGYEIYRDNMGDGPILPSSKPISSYSEYSYRGVIRNGYDVSDTICTLSVEIHVSSIISVQFEGWLSIYASSHEVSSSSICYPVLVEDVRSFADFSMMPIADFNSSSYVAFSNIDTNFYLLYNVPLAHINSWRLLTSPMLCPLTSFDIQGRLSIEDEWSEVNPSSPYTYSEIAYLNIDLRNYHHSSYKQYKLTPRTVKCFPSTSYELYPMICHQAYTVSRASSLFQEQYSMTMGDTVQIEASNSDAIGCISDPSLPGGLSFDECSIVGSPKESVNELKLTIYWQDDFGTLSQQIIISVAASGTPTQSPSSIINVIIVIIIVVVLVIVGIVLYMNSSKKRIKIKDKSTLGYNDTKTLHSSSLPSESSNSHVAPSSVSPPDSEVDGYKTLPYDPSLPTNVAYTQDPSRPTSMGYTQDPSRPTSMGYTQDLSRPTSMAYTHGPSRPTSMAYTPSHGPSRPTSVADSHPTSLRYDVPPLSTSPTSQYQGEDSRFSTSYTPSITPTCDSTTVLSMDQVSMASSLGVTTSLSMQPQPSVAPTLTVTQLMDQEESTGYKSVTSMNKNSLSMSTIQLGHLSQSQTVPTRQGSVNYNYRASENLSRSQNDQIVIDRNGNQVNLENLPFADRLKFLKDNNLLYTLC